MKVAVIGAGSAGSAVARAVAGAGHTVIISAADAEEAKQVADQVGGRVAASNEDAAREADMVMLAVPFQNVPEITQEIRSAVEGKTVVDVSNPLKPDFSGLAVTDRAGAEQVQEQLPSAFVVKAFNTVFANNQDNPRVNGDTLDGFIAGDDDAAKQVVADLLATIGYRPIDVGGLSFALALEHMAFLNISLNARHNLPWRSGWRLVGPVTNE